MFDPNLDPLPARLPRLLLDHCTSWVEIAFCPIGDFIVAFATVSYPITNNSWDVRIRFFVTEGIAGTYITTLQEDRKDFRNLPRETRKAILREVTKYRNDYHVIFG